MKFKTAEIKKIELFAPGTAGERALRIETADGVEIYDEAQYGEIEIRKTVEKFVEEFYKTDVDFPGSLGKKVAGEKVKIPKVLIEFSQDCESCNASGNVYFLQGDSDHFQEKFFEGESLSQIWQYSIDFLKEKNLPHPDYLDMEIIEEHGGYKYCYWEN